MTTDHPADLDFLRGGAPEDPAQGIVIATLIVAALWVVACVLIGALS